MTQQAQNDHYADDRSLALAYAEAVNEELRDLKAAGADVVQIDEPYLQARPEPAREYAVEAIDRALDGHRAATPCSTRASATRTSSTTGRTGYPFLRELDDCAATHISLEAAQPDLDPEVLRDARRTRRSSSACSTSARPRWRRRRSSPSGSGGRSRSSPPERLVVAPDCGMKYLPRERAFAQARGDGRRARGSSGRTSAC